MNRLSLLARSDDLSFVDKDTDHRVKMYKELRRVGPVGFTRKPLMSPDDASEAALVATTSPARGALDP